VKNRFVRRRYGIVKPRNLCTVDFAGSRRKYIRILSVSIGNAAVLLPRVVDTIVAIIRSFPLIGRCRTLRSRTVMSRARGIIIYCYRARRRIGDDGVRRSENPRRTITMGTRRDRDADQTTR